MNRKRPQYAVSNRKGLLYILAMGSLVLMGCSTPAVKEASGEQKMELAVVPPPCKCTPPMPNPSQSPSPIQKTSVSFDFDSFQVKAEYNVQLVELAKVLTKQPVSRILLSGNADERGGAEYDLALGQKRAAAVENMLKSLGVPEMQMDVVSFGKENPVAFGHDERSWSKNRRVDIIPF